jgi:hypothetical protein
LDRCAAEVLHANNGEDPIEERSAASDRTPMTPQSKQRANALAGDYSPKCPAFPEIQRWVRPWRRIPLANTASLVTYSAAFTDSTELSFSFEPPCGRHSRQRQCALEIHWPLLGWDALGKARVLSSSKVSID